MSRPIENPRIPHLSVHNWRSPTMPPLYERPANLSNPLSAPQAPVRTAGEIIVQQLVSLGLDTFFGLPGGPVIPVFHAVLTTPGARLIEPRHESGAAFMAMGYYRATGKVP